MRIFNYLHFLGVSSKFSLFSNPIINERDILVNKNHFFKNAMNSFLMPNPYYETQNI